MSASASASVPPPVAPAGYVVDASVAVKWFLPEVHDAAAQRLLSLSVPLLVPDLLFAEIGNILWKRTRLTDPTEQITQEEAQAVLTALAALPLAVHPSGPLVQAALEIASNTGRTVYDSLYLALAVKEKAPLVTADERLVNALQETPLSPHLVWVEDV